MQVAKRSMNWFPKESAWELAQAQRERRREISKTYIAHNEAVASTIQTVRDDLVFGMAEITAKVAAARVSKTA